ncbi:GTPase ObgE [candidate division WWE3 bacterium CG08_land_8_20_14_0_20_40_13]|uniref:GTPase Obg n=1 Tax=candidate division WWE3 bacterium CG08_land_8_20_14_0_20_40_13 TaxID=1975084 RepID=A0A2H0XG72_UNCKA|nr:MAG: GTPase ObgE [candidate division WWE3 bacterium CG08_land_8_20_14_0_20_40_13]
MVDKVVIKIKAGDGGDGLVHFHRERFFPKGGPDGGDGGKGGDVFFEVDSNLLSLYDFNSQRYFKAEDGRRGGGKKSYGKSAEDLIIKVPEGTVVIEREAGRWKVPACAGREDRGEKVEDGKWIEEGKGEEKGKILADLTRSGDRFLIAKGGVGGKGNYHFRSSINQIPMQFTEGENGEEKELILELKFIADVGLIGLPNSGKTSLLDALTSSRAKIANYPFTTLAPNLGVMEVREELKVQNSKLKIIVADIPGLIEGASQGKGLGHEFLKHVERTKVLVHVIDGANSELEEKYRVIREELGKWSKELLKKPEIVVVNKCDLIKDQIGILPHQTREDPVLNSAISVSAVTGEGLDILKGKIIEMVRKIPNKTFKLQKAKQKSVFTIEDLNNRSIVFKGVRDGFEGVSGFSAKAKRMFKK